MKVVLLIPLVNPLIRAAVRDCSTPSVSVMEALDHSISGQSPTLQRSEWSNPCTVRSFSCMEATPNRFFPCMEATPNRTFLCMEATYPYTIKNQRGASKIPPLGVFCVPKPLVGGFGCDELVLYGIRELASRNIMKIFQFYKGLDQ